MGNDETDLSTASTPRAGANRREVLLGATGLAVAAAAGTVFGTGVANAAPSIGPMSMEISGLGTFEVLAFSWGASNSGGFQMGGGGAGKANFQDVSITKYTDALSPALLEAIATGQHFTKATLTFAPQGGRSPLVLEGSPVLVTSMSLGGPADQARLTENLTLAFASFRFAYGQASTDLNVARG